MYMKQLVEHIGQCHSLMEDTKIMALTVALRYGDLVKQDIRKQFQEQLDKKQRWFGTSRYLILIQTKVVTVDWLGNLAKYKFFVSCCVHGHG